MALNAADGLAAPATEHPSVLGLVVDVPAQGGFATVVALTDRTTSMYTSTGGGIIGAGQHMQVAAANRALLRAAQEHLSKFDVGDDGEFPGSGCARFHLLTTSGRLRADVPEAAFWGQQHHELMPVIAATQAMISEMREAASPGAT